MFQKGSDKEPRCVKKQLLQVFYEKGVLKHFAKFPGKHLCQIPFFNKVSGLRAAFLLKKRLWRRCFPVNFAEIFKKTFFTDYFQIVASVCLPSGNNLNVNWARKSYERLMFPVFVLFKISVSAERAFSSLSILSAERYKLNTFYSFRSDCNRFLLLLIDMITIFFEN